MAKVRSWVGLDVHARSVLAVMIDGESGELNSHRLAGRTSEVVEFCRSLPGPARVAYEAGPTGYGLARALHTAGVGCVVAAPGKIERPAGDKVKTDQRDAERVLRLLMIDGLHPVRVPSGQEEALRDVVRAGARACGSQQAPRPAESTKPTSARSPPAQAVPLGNNGSRRDSSLNAAATSRSPATTTSSEPSPTFTEKSPAAPVVASSGIREAADALDREPAGSLKRRCAGLSG